MREPTGIAQLNRVSTLRVARLIMQETGTYNPQYLRPYEANLTATGLGVIMDRASTMNSKQIDSSIFNDVVTEMINPSAAPETMAQIDNSWDQRRIRFMLEIELEYASLGMSKGKMYIMGYTSFNGVTRNTAIAPDMVFYINNIIQTRSFITTNNLGMQQTMELPKNVSQVFCNTQAPNIWSDNNEIAMRPEDVFGYMQHSHIPSDYMAYGGIRETRGRVGNVAIKNNRKNNIGQKYMETLLNGYLNTRSQNDFVGIQEIEMLEKARIAVYDEAAQVDPFLSAIAQIKGGVPVTNHFTYGDLERLDPNVRAVTNYNYLGPVELAQLHQAGQTAHWQGRDAYTQAASIIAQAVPAMMMDMMIGSISVHSTNLNLGGQPCTVILSGAGFSTLDMTPTFNEFITRFDTEIVKNITYNGAISYTLSVTSNVLGDTKITISLNGDHEVDYVVPSFCDNLFAPVLTTSQQTMTNITDFADTLVSNVAEAVEGAPSGALTGQH